MAKSPAIARRYAVVHLKLGEAIGEARTLLEVAFVWPSGPKLQFALINQRPRDLEVPLRSPVDTGVPGPTVMTQRKEIVASLLPAPW
jgi:hypothetical protein